VLTFPGNVLRRVIVTAPHVSSATLAPVDWHELLYWRVT